MTAPGLYPEHDLFIQLMKLKNTLRYLRGEDLITHLGRDTTTEAADRMMARTARCHPPLSRGPVPPLPPARPPVVQHQPGRRAVASCRM